MLDEELSIIFEIDNCDFHAKCLLWNEPVHVISNNVAVWQV